MNYRVFVEKKFGFDVEAKGLLGELKESLNLTDLSNVRIFNCYDLFNINENELERAKKLIFSEVVTDLVSDKLELTDTKHFAVEYLPGQFDQRADSAMQCLNLISNDNSEVMVTSGKIIVLEGNVTDENLVRIKDFYINPVEMREKNLEKLDVETTEAPKEVPNLIGFVKLTEVEMEEFKTTEGLAMTVADLLHVQNYFKNTEDRDPTETEIGRASCRERV